MIKEATKDIPAIAVRGISKTFKIPIDGSSGIKQKIVNVFRHKKGYRNFTPLDDVSFEIQKGDFFGIVGRNGSGKSTLLKTIGGIYSPDKGHVKVNGLLVPFIELGVGFNPELTGRENVYLNGALLGFSRNEISAMYDEIVDFAELHNFMDERLKNYSSGMQVRLAFSIAIRAQGDILLLDEVLAVGDSAFQQKCFDYFEKLKREHRTIVLVTHSMDAVKRFCNRALLLDEGKVKLIGSPEEVADQYTIDNISKSGAESSTEQSSVAENVKYFEAHTNKVEFDRSDSVHIQIEYELNRTFNVMFGISVIKDGRSVAELNSIHEELNGSSGERHSLELVFQLNDFNYGQYSINVSIFEKDTRALLDSRIRITDFVIKGDDQSRGGALRIEGVWKQ